MTTPKAVHQLTLRVYYEDTDFSGRVYHAPYLRFMERGRTERAGRPGFEHGTLAGEQGLVFAVRKLEIDYLAPAVIDDLLSVETRIADLRGAVIEFAQSVSRGAADAGRGESARRGAAQRSPDPHSVGAEGGVVRDSSAAARLRVDHAIELRRQRAKAIWFFRRKQQRDRAVGPVEAGRSARVAGAFAGRTDRHQPGIRPAPSRRARHRGSRRPG